MASGGQREGILAWNFPFKNNILSHLSSGIKNSSSRAKWQTPSFFFILLSSSRLAQMSDQLPYCGWADVIPSSRNPPAPLLSITIWRKWLLNFSTLTILVENFSGDGDYFCNKLFPRWLQHAILNSLPDLLLKNLNSRWRIQFIIRLSY